MPDTPKIDQGFLETQDKVRISYTRFSSGHDDVLVIAPGFNQTKDTRIFKKLALDFSKDFDCISFDVRGHGKSKGTYTFGSEEGKDLKAILDYAHQYYNKVHLIAFSISALVAVNEVSKSNNVSTLILVSCPMSFEEIEGHFWTPEAMKIGFASVKEGDVIITLGNPFSRKEKAIDNIGKVKIPVLFIYGAKDPIIKIRHSEILYEKANFPKKLVVIKEGSHAEDLYRQFPDEFMRTCREFFEREIDYASSIKIR